MNAPDDSPEVPVTEENTRSLAVIRDELNLRVGEQERRANSFDTRAGLVLGFTGVLVGLSAADANWWVIAGQISAVIGSVGAAYSLWPRVSGAVGIQIKGGNVGEESITFEDKGGEAL